MSHLPAFLLALAALLLSGGTPLRAEDEGDPTPDQIQQFLRFSYALQEGDLKGRLRSGDKDLVIPFDLTLFDNTVRFKFDNPAQIINLDLTAEGNELTEIVPGRKAPVPPQRYHEKVRGTEITYEDLAMRFLYWPKPQLIDEDKIKFQKCWVLRVFNPGTLGPYRAVDVWVEQKGGAILQMRGYDFKTGSLIKEFKVTRVQKDGDGYILEQMRIETFKVGDDVFPIARTYLEIDPPAKK